MALEEFNENLHLTPLPIQTFSDSTHTPKTEEKHLRNKFSIFVPSVCSRPFFSGRVGLRVGAHLSFPILLPTNNVQWLLCWSTSYEPSGVGRRLQRLPSSKEFPKAYLSCVGKRGFDWRRNYDLVGNDDDGSTMIREWCHLASEQALVMHMP